jgi:hypothetical protein
MDKNISNMKSLEKLLLMDSLVDDTRNKKLILKLVLFNIRNLYRFHTHGTLWMEQCDKLVLI